MQSPLFQRSSRFGYDRKMNNEPLEREPVSNEPLEREPIDRMRARLQSSETFIGSPLNICAASNSAFTVTAASWRSKPSFTSEHRSRPPLSAKKAPPKSRKRPPPPHLPSRAGRSSWWLVIRAHVCFGG